ncbi:MAG: hypothetical protein GY811_18715 [Myxococcales bacterium]|nr:hypothetical protein [Myxococcales bacterium]
MISRIRALLLLSLLALMAMELAPRSAHAEEKGVFGVGLIVGEPTGLSLKYYQGDDTAIDGAIGGAFLGKGLQVHADYLWHPWMLENKPSFALPAYVGVGGRILDRNGGGGDEDHFRLGARFVGGVLFDFREVPLDVFVEVAGVADYRTKGSPFGIDINLGAGVRYYF